MSLIKSKLLLIATALLAASMGAHAAPYFTNQKGNLIWDQATGRVWMRCSLGQTWANNSCTGTASQYDFQGAQKAAQALNAGGGYAGATDWQVPSARDLASLRDCSAGFGTQTVDIQDGQRLVTQSCKDGAPGPTPMIDTIAFPGVSRGDIWTSSPYEGNSYDAWVVSFRNGYVINSLRNGNAYVQLVRDSRLLGSEAASVFPVKLQSTQATREAAERKTQAKTQADRAQALKQLLALGARGLYLEAGKAQRNGSVTFVNTRFGAEELYEMIVNKFPDSDYAIKATDQLTAMSRSSRERSAAREAAQATREAAESNRAAAEQANNSARQRAYNACKVEINTCYSRTNGKGNCYWDCDSLLR